MLIGVSGVKGKGVNFCLLFQKLGIARWSYLRFRLVQCLSREFLKLFSDLELTTYGGRVFHGFTIRWVNELSLGWVLSHLSKKSLKLCPLVFVVDSVS